MRIAALAIGLYLAAGILATWPAVKDSGDAYLAQAAPAYGEAAAGDHLQLGWAFWLVGHQLENLAAPWEDPYSFQPVSDAPPNLLGWLYGLPYWPVHVLAGPVWAYNVVLLLSFVLAGCAAALWLRALGLTLGAALVGGLVFTLAPYRVAQASAGHLLGMVVFLIPAALYAIEKRRLALAGLALAAIPLSGQLHVAGGAVALALAYALVRLPRADWPAAVVATVAPAVAAVGVHAIVVDGSIAEGRSFNQVRRYSAEAADFFRRADASPEVLVFLGWVTLALAIVGLAVLVGSKQPWLAAVLGTALLVPCLLALGANLPGYEWLWETVPGVDVSRVPGRFMPVACLALAALVAIALDVALQERPVVVAVVGTALAIALVGADLRWQIEPFSSVQADHDSAAYAAIDDDGRLLELPVIRPDIHYGSVYLGYARQSPRERPLGYSTVARPAAAAWAKQHRELSCGVGRIPGGIEWIAVHRGVYRQSGFFAADCPSRAEAALRAAGWREVARDAVITMWRAPRTAAAA